MITCYYVVHAAFFSPNLFLLIAFLILLPFSLKYDFII